MSRVKADANPILQYDAPQYSPTRDDKRYEESHLIDAAADHSAKQRSARLYLVAGNSRSIGSRHNPIPGIRTQSVQGPRTVKTINQSCSLYHEFTSPLSREPHSSITEKFGVVPSRTRKSLIPSRSRLEPPCHSTRSRTTW